MKLPRDCTPGRRRRGSALHPVRVATDHEVRAGTDEPSRDVLLDRQGRRVLVAPVGHHGHHVHAPGQSSYVPEHAVELGPVERPRADRHADRLAPGWPGPASGVSPMALKPTNPNGRRAARDRRPAGFGQVAPAPNGPTPASASRSTVCTSARLAVVAGVVVRRARARRTRRPQAARHPRVGGERVAALGGGPSSRACSRGCRR